MAYGTLDDFTEHDHERPKALPQKLFGGIALACIAFASAWTLYVNLAAPSGDAVLAGPSVDVVLKQPAAPAVPATRAPRTARTLLVAPVLDVTIFSKGTSGMPPETFSRNAPLQARLQPMRPTDIARTQNGAPQPAVRVVQSVPLPAPRPAGAGTPGHPALQAMAQRNKLSLASASDPFEKLFGRRQDAGPALAYAAPDGGVFGNGRSIAPGRMPPNDGLTAIYDISARTVYMPDGTKLEAHSGLGGMLDDPRHVHVKMRGATPPHVYDLTMRESLFHGVQAIRLTPVGGEGEIFGRTGLLAHTYMLGPNGDSNGCVSFKNYDAFLRAYMNNKVKRLVVIASLG